MRRGGAGGWRRRSGKREDEEWEERGMGGRGRQVAYSCFTAQRLSITLIPVILQFTRCPAIRKDLLPFTSHR